MVAYVATRRERLANETAEERKARLMFMLHTHSVTYSIYIHGGAHTASHVHCTITQYRVSRMVESRVEYTLRFLASDV